MCFLFLKHNQNARVREQLLKMMKPAGSLYNAFQITRMAEGTLHSEELSRQYLDMVKKDTQIDSIHHNKSKCDKSKGYGNGQQHCSSSGKQEHKGNCHNFGSKHPPSMTQRMSLLQEKRALFQMLPHQSSIPVFTSQV